MRIVALVIVCLAAANVALAQSTLCEKSQAQINAIITATAANLQNRGWGVVEGLMNFTQQGGGGFGSNPSGRYGIYFLPNSAGTLSFSWKLGLREAVLWVGCTPPPLKYFSYRSYLFTKRSVSPPALVFASLGDANNQLTAKPRDGSPFGRATAVVSTADQSTYASVALALAASGLPTAATNVDVMPANRATFGTESTADDFSYLMRASVYDNEAQGNAYMSQTWKIFKLTPPAGNANSYPQPNIRNRGTGTNEDIYINSTNELAQAVITSMVTSGYTLTAQRVMDENPFYGYTCINLNVNCNGDVRDTVYSGDSNRQLPTNRVIYVVGTNSMLTGKTTYNAVAVNSAGSGIVGSDSTKWLGSANIFAPNTPFIDKLFALKVSRSCGGQQFCLEVPDTLPVTAPISLVARSYLEPATATAPAAAEILAPIVLVFDL